MVSVNQLISYNKTAPSVYQRKTEGRISLLILLFYLIKQMANSSELAICFIKCLIHQRS